MTSSKSVSWSALVNIGNNESFALTVSGEAATPDEARDIFAFACGQLLGVANSADVDTAAMILAYVSRLILIEEARPVERNAPAPAPKKELWEPKITKPSYDKMQEERKSAPTPPSRVPTAKEQAAAAVAQCIKPPVDVEDIARQQHADKLKADLERLQADHDTRVARRAATAPDPAPSAPPTPEAPVSGAPQSGAVCANCGAAVSASQAKLSLLFMSKTLCKSCMEATA